MSLVFTSLILFTFPVHSSSIPSIIDTSDIVEQTCRQTPYYDLCLWTLRSIPQSHNANIRELAQIMVDTLDSRDVPEAISKGDYKSAEQGTFDAATEARSCERGFSRGRSPLSDQNKLVHHTSIVAAAIVKAIARGG
ncbi:cell wall / vacuolar inhibitor of fructosidase 1-like [Tripterygium wilfordii]|uniref:cell wall / vacuolar inhibitor of fructosidase 1-like n=1 Tax=Tripterygium wilfordii TaxID=458696 RepID=UPI0018F85615|nr:cell wall / vacuolar inhibitor of fructosidase 1-like [Tripterygium wilfordii]